MRITSIRLQNFLSVGEPGLSLEQIEQRMVLVGPNGVGKTNMLRAIELVCTVFWGGRVDLSPYSHRGDIGGEMRVSVTAHLSLEETEAIADLLVVAIPRESQFESESGMGHAEVRESLREVVSYCRPLFRDLFGGEVTFEIRARGGDQGYAEHYVRLAQRNVSVYLAGRSYFARTPDQQTGYTRVSWPLEFAKQIYSTVPGSEPKSGPPRRVTSEEAKTIAAKCDMDWFDSILRSAGSTPPRMEIKVFDYRSDHTRNGSEVPELMRLADKLRNWRFSNDDLALTDLLGGLLRSAVTTLSEARRRPERWTTDEYNLVPPALNTIDGSELSLAILRLKDGVERESRERFQALSDAFLRLSGYKVDVVLQVIDEAGNRIDNVYGPALRALTETKADGSPRPPPKLVPTIVLETDGVEIPLDFCAAGVFELLLVLYAVYASSGSILLLDEPALNLHPAKQRELALEIESAARSRGLQLVLVTHSPFFVGTTDLGAIARVEREGGKTVVYRLPALAPTELERLRLDLNRFPKLVAALFARKVVLVEGDGEEAAFPIWLQKCGSSVDLAAKGVEFISVGGQLFFDRHLTPLRAWHIPFRLVGDGKAAPVLAKHRQNAFAYASDDLGHVIEDHFAKELELIYDELGGRPAAKAPVIARLVALATDPPVEIQGVWSFLERFVTED